MECRGLSIAIADGFHHSMAATVTVFSFGIITQRLGANPLLV
jgi:hypothetical protein